MTTTIFEENPKDTNRSEGPIGDAKRVIEKQARQLAYDIRYQIKKEMGDKRLDPATLKREYIKGIQKSSQPPAIKLRARQMLLGEDYISNIETIASESLANAMYKVFVEGNDASNFELELDYLKELADVKDAKYKIRVTDKKTGNSYVRYATREKISELRSNPNISSVEMTEHGEPREGERTRGENTARVKGGKKDYDGDGKKESGAKEYRGVVHNAIQRRKGGIPDGKDTSSVREEFLGEIRKEEKKEKKNGKITGEGVDNSSIIKVFPDDQTAPSRHGMVVANSYQVDGPILSEKSISRSQQKFMGMVLATKRGKKAPSPEVAKAASEMSEKEAKKFAKTKHKGLPGHVKEASECESDEKDTRGDYARKEVIKNRIRAAVGVKNPIIMTDGYDSKYGRGEMGEPRGTQRMKVDPEAWEKSRKEWEKIHPDIYKPKTPQAKTKTKTKSKPA